MSKFKLSPSFRFAARTVLVAVVSYVVSVLAQGGKITDWHSFAWGLAGAALYALLGVLTPIEPKVGVKTPVQG